MFFSRAPSGCHQFKTAFLYLTYPPHPPSHSKLRCVCAYHMNSGMQWPLEAQTSQHCMDWGGEGGCKEVEAEYDDRGNGES